MKKIALFVMLTIITLSAYSQELGKGYRGFAEAGFCVGNLPDATVLGPQNVNRLNISTVHGYQFNPHFFLGGGFVNHIYAEGHYSVSLFANIRVDILSKTKTPFIDVRGGHCYGDFQEDLDLEDGYLSFSAGFRFNHCNVSAGWDVSPMEYAKGTTISNSTVCKVVANSFLVKFAYDWGAREKNN